MSGRWRFAWRQKHFVIDGEPVVLRVDGISDFNAPHSRKCAFDILAMGGNDLWPLPLHLRKANLERVAPPAGGITVAPFERGEIGPAVFRAACRMGPRAGFQALRSALSRRPAAALHCSIPLLEPNLSETPHAPAGNGSAWQFVSQPEQTEVSVRVRLVPICILLSCGLAAAQPTTKGDINAPTGRSAPEDVNCSRKVGPGRSKPSQAVRLRKVPRDKAHQGCSRHRMDQQKQRSSLPSSVNWQVAHRYRRTTVNRSAM